MLIAYNTANLFITPSPLNGSIINYSFALILYSLLNGFYEEIFFLGVCLCVKPKSIKWVLPLSILIRFSFHTYQGFINAMGIGIVGGLMFYLLYSRSKDKNLAPFFITHTISDIIGMGLLSYIYIFLNIISQ